MNPAAYLVIVLLVSNVVTGGLWLDGRRVLAELRASAAETTTDRVREQQREIGRLIAVTTNLNEAYREQIKTIDSAQARIAADADRMRQLKAQRSSAIAAATPDAVRGYATAAGDVYEACRSEYRALGFDAERCSSAAHTLNDWAKALTREDIDATRATLRQPTGVTP